MTALPPGLASPNFALLGFSLLAWLLMPAARLQAAEPELVGVLALLVEGDVAEQLELTDAQMEKLLDVIDERETGALELILQIKDLPPQQRREKLAPYRAESEKLGLAVLTDEQRGKLTEIRLKKQGLSALADEQLAEKLELSEAQRTRLDQILRERRDDLSTARGEEVEQVKRRYDAQLSAVLTEEQRGEWEKLAGASAPMPRAEAKPRVPPEPMPGDTRPEPKVAARPEPGGTQPSGDGRLRFNFKYERWKDVLEWFADQAQLSLNMDVPPEGTLNYTDTRGYTPTEALNVINSVLLTKGYTLLRRDRALILIDLADGIPPDLVRSVSPGELDDLGEYEVVRTLFPLRKMTAEEAEEEIKNLIGPQGSIAVLPKSQHVQVTETVGRLRHIRRVIEAVEGPTDSGGELRQFELQYVSADEVMPIIRKLLNIPEETDAAADGSLRMAVDLDGGKILASGKSHRLAELEEVIKTLDVPSSSDGGPVTPLQPPQLEVYDTGQADPESVLQVMQTLLSGMPDVRLATDPQTGNLVALARPAQHRTIRATLDQMQADVDQIEVIKLRAVDPQVAVLAINKLFGEDGKGGAKAPTIDADLGSSSLLVRASPGQIKQIHDLLDQMGEGDAGDDLPAEDRGPVRMIPLSGRQVRAALGQLEQIWPTLRPNRIRVVSPSRAIPTYRPNRTRPPKPPGSAKDPEGNFEEVPLPKLPPAQGESQDAPAGAKEKSESDKSAVLDQASPFRLVVQKPQKQDQPGAAERTPAGETAAAKDDAAKDDAAKDDRGDRSPSGKKPAAKKPPEIVVAPGGSSTMIASEDVEALDEFESLLNSIAGRRQAGRDFTVFYLKYAKANVVAETLGEIFGTDAGGGGGGGGLLGDIAGAALGDVGGGLVSNLLGGAEGGGGGGAEPAISTFGEIDIVPDARLNALVVQAMPADLDMIEQLLQILDQQASPEDVEVIARPKLIAVYNTSAAEIADVVRQVYQDRLTTAAAATAARSPSPRDLIQALRSGRSRGRSSAGGGESELPKMTIGVDARSNSLVVSAPQPLFEEVRELVRELDSAGTTSEETMQVVTLKRSNPQAVGRALRAILGESVQTTLDTSQPATPANGTPKPTASGGDSGSQRFDPSEFRRRRELFERLRRETGGSREGGRSGERGSSPTTTPRAKPGE